MWFRHRVTGARQEAKEGTRVFERFKKSPAWISEDEATATQAALNKAVEQGAGWPAGTPVTPSKPPTETGLSDIKHVGGGIFALPDGTRIKGRSAAEEEMKRREFEAAAAGV